MYVLCIYLYTNVCACITYISDVSYTKIYRDIEIICIQPVFPILVYREEYC